MSAVLTHVIESIGPASAAMAAARAQEGAGPIAAWLAGARHSTRPRVERRVVLCVACDHAVVDAGVAFGDGHPTIAAVRAIAAGEAALAKAARDAGAVVVIVDAGVAEPDGLPEAVIGVARGRAGDLSEGAALTPIEAMAAMEAGVALVTALVEDGMDVMAVGAIGAGGDLAAAAVIAALVRTSPDPDPVPRGDAGAELAPIDGRELVAAGLATIPARATAIDVVQAVGGRDIAVLAGAMLAAASLHVPVIVDGAVTIAAALVAARLAPAITGYFLAAHAGGGPAATAGRAALGREPLLSAGLGHGEGTGAVLLLPLVAAAAG